MPTRSATCSPACRVPARATQRALRTWPGSAELYLPAPEVGSLFRNPALAATYARILDESRGGSREEEIEKARRAYYEGFVAEEIDRFVAAEGGLLTADIHDAGQQHIVDVSKTGPSSTSPKW